MNPSRVSVVDMSTDVEGETASFSRCDVVTHFDLCVSARAHPPRPGRPRSRTAHSLRFSRFRGPPHPSSTTHAGFIFAYSDSTSPKSGGTHARTFTLGTLGTCTLGTFG